MHLYYNRIKEVLVRKKRTTLELAKHLKVRKETVSKWNGNKNQPPISTLYEIAKFLGVEMSDLLNTVSMIEELQKKSPKKDE